MKLYIMTDMEGICGINSWKEQIDSDEDGYLSRKFLTNEVNAFIEGAFNGGASEIVVADGHNGGHNLLIDKMDKRAKIIDGRPGDLILPYLDDDYDGLFIVGAHSMMGVYNGVLNHSFSSKSFYEIKINDQSIGEIGIIMILASSYKIPIFAISGDEKACEEAQNKLENIFTIKTKKGISRYASIFSNPQVINEKIRKSIEKHMRIFKENKDDYILDISYPLEIKIKYISNHEVNKALFVPTVTKAGDREIKFNAKTPKELSDMIYLLLYILD